MQSKSDQKGKAIIQKVFLFLSSLLLVDLIAINMTSASAPLCFLPASFPALKQLPSGRISSMIFYILGILFISAEIGPGAG